MADAAWCTPPLLGAKKEARREGSDEAHLDHQADDGFKRRKHRPTLMVVASCYIVRRLPEQPASR
jgi:hypothetical protein